MAAFSSRARLLSVPVRVHVVDPSAYTPPYDHALCRALGEAGADVELYTSRFSHGRVPAAVAYGRHELFYRRAGGVAAAAPRRAVKLAEHVPDMLRYRALAARADVVHFQWLPVQQLDGLLLPRSRERGGRPLVLTAHDILPREPRPGQRRAQRRLYGRFDAIVVHSEHGRDRLTAELGVDPARVHVIPHGAFAHLAAQPPGAAVELPSETRAPVVLCFGLIRPYKGIDVLLEAWRAVQGAELWVVGMPRMDLSEQIARAPAGVRFVTRFVSDEELAAYFRRADLVVLPYREIDQSGVLFTALAFGRPLLLSDVGGFPTLATAGAARTFPAGDAHALAGQLRELLADGEARAALATGARAAAAGTYSWANVARHTLELYAQLLGRAPPDVPVSPPARSPR
jgi:glycosyltransferase involved in cell wall biosynthesis